MGDTLVINSAKDSTNCKVSRKQFIYVYLYFFKSILRKLSKQNNTRKLNKQN